MSKKGLKQAQIIGIKINSTSREGVIRKILQRIRADQKTIVFTPNPEFIVFAKKNPWFKKALNLADFAIPDGVGLIWAGRFLGQPVKERIHGSDLVADLLEIAEKRGWSVGVIGTRWGVKGERQALTKKLQERYPSVKIFGIEDTPGWQDKKLELVFACQGMGKQEKWILENKNRSKGLVFMGVGGSLDFLTGFTKRAPISWRKLGLEWLWRGLKKPAHFRRIWRALIEFPLLALKEKLSGS